MIAIRRRVVFGVSPEPELSAHRGRLAAHRFTIGRPLKAPIGKDEQIGGVGPVHGCQARRVESRGEITILPVKTCNLPCYEKGAQMTVSELIDELRAMPPDATVMLWSRIDEPQHRRPESVELSTTKSDPHAEVVVLS
jgi:hypothetical protein